MEGVVMQLDLCCSTPDLIWRTRPVGKRFADQYACTCCDTVHRTEQWFAPFAWKSRSDCINCGAPGQAYGTCSRCQSTLTKTLTLHHKLIRLHPDLDPCKGAQIAFDAGRSLLCLKLATISLYQNPQSVPARLLRLKVMEKIGFITPALDQAWDWVDEGAPPDVWTVIANLEAAQGNVDGALFALERGIQCAPKSGALWIEYAELLAYKDNRPLAIQAAHRVVDMDTVRDRAVHVIATMADRYFSEDMIPEAIKALNLTGPKASNNVVTAWLRAQIAFNTNQINECIKWLEVVMVLCPQHSGAEALHAMCYDTLKEHEKNRMRRAHEAANTPITRQASAVSY